ncbi:MAG: sigma-E processing peptidase SpoIIGA [Clostridia bacterium]|nr:sigma-E processing peptidase SpoIIGA [Clostridia bacterium]
MIVYIEMVLLENMLIDGLILYLVLKSLALNHKWLKLIFSSFVGAVFSVFSVYLSFGVFNIFIKIAMAVFMCFLIELNFKKIFLKTLLFMLFTFLFGGAIIAIFSFLGIKGVGGMSYSYNSNIPVGGILATSVILFLFLTNVLKKFYIKKNIQKFLYNITIKLNNKVANLKGFLDTGNTLTNKQGKPVLMICEEKLKNWFSDDDRINFLLKKYSKLNNPQTIKVNSISGFKNILVFDAEKCFFNNKNIDVCVGVSEDRFFKNKGFDVILSPKIMEV